MKRYEKTGVIENLNINQGHFGDFSNVQSYQESLNQIMLAQNMFDSLPAQVRKYFENDPILFVEFASNPENADTLIEMGLAEPKPSTGEESPNAEGEGDNPKPSPPLKNNQKSQEEAKEEA